jgi:NAD(P)-dependent dehydrogenase (short-subunit alcohol dehydrogenase family)
MAISLIPLRPKRSLTLLSRGLAALTSWSTMLACWCPSLLLPFIDYTPDDFEALVSTILAGFFYISQSAARQMLRQQSGHIVNISTSVVDHTHRMVLVLGGLGC